MIRLKFTLAAMMMSLFEGMFFEDRTELEWMLSGWISLVLYQSKKNCCFMSVNTHTHPHSLTHINAIYEAHLQKCVRIQYSLNICLYLHISFIFLYPSLSFFPFYLSPSLLFLFLSLSFFIFLLFPSFLFFFFFLFFLSLSLSYLSQRMFFYLSFVSFK